ncbi:MAG: hypothetical protein NZ959_08140 [Armatimonadetes bacterium]|nr:hypothetical protein [Armatimonadota bacterium]MDW8122507.1 hypothetical protein [Armatimonadota bacterium]
MPVIPEVNPIPLPAPPFLLSLLLHLTFLLHLIPMNLTVGGISYLLYSEAIRNNSPVADWVRSYLPASTALTITTGVAPLLFVQVLYGQFFFPATIVMAWSWLLIIPALLIGYSSLYYYLNKRQSLRFPWIPLSLTLFLFLYIAFLFANMATLMSTPSKWQTLYRSDPSGWNLNLTDLSLVPRFFHFFLGACAVFGLVGAVYGGLLRSADPVRAQSLLSTGSRWFVSFTLLNFLVGPLFLLSQPAPIRANLLGAHPEGTFLLVVSILTAAAAMALTLSYQRSPSKNLLLIAGSLLSVTLIAMGRIRFLVRQWTIAFEVPDFRISQIPAQPDWLLFAVFVVVLMGGLAIIFWIVKNWFTSAVREGAP